MSEFTPGPWEVVSATDNDGRSRRYVDARHASVEVAYCGMDGAETVANARLIAAAPELLEALTRIANVDKEPMLASEVIELARAAIAKATNG